MNSILKSLSVIGLALTLNACGQADDSTSQESAVSNQETSPVETEQSESERLYAFFQLVWEDQLARSPRTQAMLGIKTDNDKWNDLSEARALEDIEIVRQNLTRLAEFDYAALSETAGLSYELIERRWQQQLREWPYRDHNYPINTMFGPHIQTTTFLADSHRVDERADAEAYIARLNGLGVYFDQIIEGLDRREQAGVLPPAFVFPIVIPGAVSVIAGAPFDESGEDSLIRADFRRKIVALGLPEEEGAELIRLADEALLAVVGPAYKRLIATLEAQAAVATTEDGVWKLPNGEAYYNAMLARHTTTDLTADEIHNIGLENVDRIHGEMQEIMGLVGFEGSLAEFFDFTRQDSQFFYPNTDEGRQEYMESLTNYIDTMRKNLPGYFSVFPKAEMLIKRIDPSMEAANGLGYYNQPARDGSRPGILYVNLSDMSQHSTFQSEALAYHEGIPGHHMQRAIAQEIEDIPMLQRFTNFTAYSEGWGLYSEYLAKDMGFYQDPYSDYGRLAWELWRAARLVVDTGLHARRWTREQAIQYMLDNTPNPESYITIEVNRYVVMPGQATAYMIGRIKILELRNWAEAELGGDFDMAGFHDQVLRFGPVPLDILEANIQRWVASLKAS